MVQLFPVVFTG